MPIRMKVRLLSRNSSMPRPETLGQHAVACRPRVMRHCFVDRGPRVTNPDVLPEDRLELRGIGHDRVDLPVPLARRRRRPVLS